MKHRPPRLAQLGLLLLCSTLAGAQTTPRSSSERIKSSYENVEIAVVADAVSAATGVRFILDQRVRGLITLRNPPSGTGLTPRQFYDLFLSVLQVYGFAAVPSGNVVKIVPESVAMRLPGNDLPANLNMGADEMVTTVLESKNINALQLSTTLRPLLTQAGQLNSVPGTNSMFITDRASNVAKIQRLLARVDQSSNASVDKIALENAVASEVARTISSLTAGQPADAAGGTVPRVIADDRTNSVLVSGDPAQRLRIAAWVESLDAPVSNGGGTRVIKLKYANADEITATLKAQVSGVTTGAAGGAGAGAAATSASAVADRSVTILPDKQTNQLIITAPPRTMLSLLAIIDELDIPLPQVFIEAVIAEVNDHRAAELGVNWAMFGDGSGIPVGGFISPIGGSSIVNLAQIVANPDSVTDPAQIPTGTTFGVGRLRDSGNIAAMVRALQTDGTSNVIGKPSTTATNNQEAVMNSGKNVPFLSGQYTNAGGGTGGNVNPFSTVQRKDVGTTLKVTPQIIPGTDEVILKIDLEDSTLTGQTGDGGSSIISTRSVKTTVRAHTGTTIVIGGMKSDGNDQSESRVPLLGRIPLLGELFRTRSRKRDKTNLMIFIRPEILRDALQASAVTNTKLHELEEMQRLQNSRKEILPLLPSATPPELPDYSAPPPAPPPAPAGAPAKP